MGNSTEYLTPRMNPPAEISDGAWGNKWIGHFLGSPTINILGILIAKSVFYCSTALSPFDPGCVSSLWCITFLPPVWGGVWFTSRITGSVVTKTTSGSVGCPMAWMSSK